MKATRLDLKNKRIGKLIITGQLPVKSTKAQIWKCLCDCGKTINLTNRQLTNHGWKSCGCLKSENQRKIGSRRALETPIRALQNTAYRMLCKNAKVRKIKVTLTFNKFLNLVLQNCIYCNSSPRNHIKPCKKNTNPVYTDLKFWYNGLDRVNNAKGYTATNCVPCCILCNRAKSDMALEEFKNWIRQAYRFQNQTLAAYTGI